MILTSLYVGDKPMAGAIGDAVVDNYRRSTEAENSAS